MTIPLAIPAAAVSCAMLMAAATPAAQPLDRPVYQAVEASRAATLELLQTIVDVDSGTGDIAGGERVETLLEPRLEAAGAQVRSIPAEQTGLAPNRVATWHGTGRGRMLIIAHIDTVFGPGTAAKRPFRIEKGRAYGPGVGDEKGGAVEAVMALGILQQLHFKDYATITLLLDGSEELGSPGSTELVKTLSRQSDVVYNMEPGAPPDGLTVWRKGASNIILRVRGRSAHAGLEPEKGRNALLELVHQIAAVDSLFPHSGDGTTVNLTVINGGDRTNIIPEAAEGIFDVRFRQPGELDTIVARMRAHLAPPLVPDTTISVSTDRFVYAPMMETSQVDALAGLAQGIYAELGKTLSFSGNGGASESNMAMSVGVPALDGLGFVGGGFHTDQEWIELSSITPRLYLLTRMLMETGRRAPTQREAGTP